MAAARTGEAEAARQAAEAAEGGVMDPDYSLHQLDTGEDRINCLPFTFSGLAIRDRGQFREVFGGLVAMDGVTYSIVIRTKQTEQELLAICAETGGHAAISDGLIDDQAWSLQGHTFHYVDGHINPAAYLGSGTRVLAHIVVARMKDGHEEGSGFLNSLRQTVAYRCPCRLCDVPITADLLGCVVVAMPPHEGPVVTVNAVSFGVCRFCDDGDDDALGDLMSDALDRDPRLQAQVYVPPPKLSRQARRLAERQTRKRTRP